MVVKFLLSCVLFFALAQAQASQPERVLILGDSITEGYGLAQEASFPFVLQRLLNQRGKSEVKIQDAGVSGATSASGPSRLNWQLKSGAPDILILELGANDGLRGLPPAEMKKNLKETIEIAKKKAVRVLLLGMKAPPNFGQAYIKEYDAVFPAIAREEKISLMPFFLEGVAGEPSLNQADGIHPNQKGAGIVAANILKYLEPLL